MESLSIPNIFTGIFPRWSMEINLLDPWNIPSHVSRKPFASIDMKTASNLLIIEKVEANDFKEKNPVKLHLFLFIFISSLLSINKGSLNISMTTRKKIPENTCVCKIECVRIVRGTCTCLCYFLRQIIVRFPSTCPQSASIQGFFYSYGRSSSESGSKSELRLFARRNSTPVQLLLLQKRLHSGPSDTVWGPSWLQGPLFVSEPCHRVGIHTASLSGSECSSLGLLPFARAHLRGVEKGKEVSPCAWLRLHLWNTCGPGAPRKWSDLFFLLFMSGWKKNVLKQNTHEQPNHMFSPLGLWVYIQRFPDDVY